MKRLAALLILLLPSAAFADRLGGLKSNADVALSTQAVSLATLYYTTGTWSANQYFGGGTYLFGDVFHPTGGQNVVPYLDDNSQLKGIPYFGWDGGSNPLRLTTIDLSLSSDDDVILGKRLDGSTVFGYFNVAGGQIFLDSDETVIRESLAFATSFGTPAGFAFDGSGDGWLNVYGRIGGVTKGSMMWDLSRSTAVYFSGNSNSTSFVFDQFNVKSDTFTVQKALYGTNNSSGTINYVLTNTAAGPQWAAAGAGTATQIYPATSTIFAPGITVSTLTVLSSSTLNGSMTVTSIPSSFSGRQGRLIFQPTTSSFDAGSYMSSYGTGEDLIVQDCSGATCEGFSIGYAGAITFGLSSNSRGAVFNKSNHVFSSTGTNNTYRSAILSTLLNTDYMPSSTILFSADTLVNGLPGDPPTPDVLTNLFKITAAQTSVSNDFYINADVYVTGTIYDDGGENYIQVRDGFGDMYIVTPNDLYLQGSSILIDTAELSPKIGHTPIQLGGINNPFNGIYLSSQVITSRTTDQLVLASSATLNWPATTFRKISLPDYSGDVSLRQSTETFTGAKTFSALVTASTITVTSSATIKRLDVQDTLNANSTPFRVFNDALSSGDNLKGVQISLNTVGRPELEGIQVDGGINDFLEFRGRNATGGDLVITANSTGWANAKPINNTGNIFAASVPMLNMTATDIAELGPNYVALSTRWRTFPLKLYYGQNSSTGTANGGYLAFVRKNNGGGETEVGRWAAQCEFAVGTSTPAAALDVNSSSGTNVRLTYNDSDGAAANYVELKVSSSGDLTINPSGGDVISTGTLSVQGTAAQINPLVYLKNSAGTEYATFASTRAGVSNNEGIFTFRDRGLAPVSDGSPDNYTDYGAVLSVHVDDHNAYLAKFYNDTYSAITPVFSYFAFDSGTFVMATEGAVPMQFGTNGYTNVRMTIQGDGTVSIGTTSDSTDALNVNGNINASSYSAGTQTGASGSFIASSGETVTVTNGIVTSIVSP